MKRRIVWKNRETKSIFYKSLYILSATCSLEVCCTRERLSKSCRLKYIVRDTYCVYTVTLHAAIGSALRKSVWHLTSSNVSKVLKLQDLIQIDCIVNSSDQSAYSYISSCSNEQIYTIILTKCIHYAHNNPTLKLHFITFCIFLWQILQSPCNHYLLAKP